VTYLDSADRQEISALAHNNTAEDGKEKEKKEEKNKQ